MRIDTSPDLGLIRYQLGEGLSQAKSLLADLVSHEGVAGVRRIALVEYEVDHREHGRQLRARRRAVVRSQAPGRSGIPFAGE